MILDSAVVVVSSEVRTEQGCVHALPQGPFDASSHPRYVGRQWEGGKHGGMAQSKWMPSLNLGCLERMHIVIIEWKLFVLWVENIHCHNTFGYYGPQFGHIKNSRWL